jgi:translation initiation factor 4A
MSSNNNISSSNEINENEKNVKSQEKKQLSDEFDDLPESIDDFEKMDFLSEELFMGIHEYGFKYPSPIQSRTIHIVNAGCDLIAQSQSGTGKTGAFTIGSLSLVDPSKKYPQVMIMVNTRPLACQIAKVVEEISSYMNIKVCLCVGGYKIDPRKNAKEASKSHVLVGTPGRIGDLINKKAFNGNRLKILVMDESDVLLSNDFREQVMSIIQNVGSKTQICIFSATFPKEILELTENFLNDPYRVTIKKEKVSLERVKQYKIDVGYDRNKFMVLEDLFGQLMLSQIIIFVNSIRQAELLRNKLMDKQIEAGLVHGKMASIDRENILKEFRLCNIKMLISTDVMCRGIDIDDLRCVINYDMADNETYIHRVGRSGRYGGQGIALNFCTYDDMHKLKSLERNYDIQIPRMPDTETVNEYLCGMKMPENKVLSSKLYKY